MEQKDYLIIGAVGLVLVGVVYVVLAKREEPPVREVKGQISALDVYVTY